MESKLQIYNRIIATLKELKPEFVDASSLTIQKRVLLLEEFRSAVHIGLYAPYENEVQTKFLFTEATKYRKELYYPAIDEGLQLLRFCRVTDFSELAKNKEGMLEPSSQTGKLRDLNTLEVLVVPGVAFDLRGSRLGFGSGMYDKCLKDFRGKRIAFAYDFQVVPELPAVVRGQKVDFIITESRIIRCMPR